MFCIRKFADGWAVFNLDTDKSRLLTDAEKERVAREIPTLEDPKTAAHYTDRIDCLDNLP